MFYFNVAILISFHMRKKRQLEASYHEKKIWEALKSMRPQLRDQTVTMQNFSKLSGKQLDVLYQKCY